MLNPIKNMLGALVTLGLLSTGVWVPKGVAQVQWRMPSWLMARVYIPRPRRDKGSPAGDSTIGQERSGDQDYKLIALVPVDVERYVDNPEDIEPFIPVIEDQPTFWFHVPAGCPQAVPQCSFRFELVEYESGEKVFSQDIEPQSAPGLLGVTVVPPEGRLQPQLKYRWRLRLLRAREKRTAFYVFGNFERVAPEDGLKQTLASETAPRQKYLAVGNQGHWFEALTGVLAQYALEPGNADVMEDWQDQWRWMKVSCEPLQPSTTVKQGFIPLNCVDEKESMW